MRIFRKLHKWLGLLVGIQFVIWVLSGLLINLVDQEEASGVVSHRPKSAPSPLAEAGPIVPLSALADSVEFVDSVSLSQFITGPVYRVGTGANALLYDATLGERIRIDRSMAEDIASESYGGAALPLSITRLGSGTDEVRGVPGPIWQVQYDDHLKTRIYISENDGTVLAHRNNRWELKDFLLMLHFMDYVRTDDFNTNTPQIIVFGIATLWLAISGSLLVINSFSRADFLWVPGLNPGQNTFKTRIRSELVSECQVALPKALSYLAALSQRDIRIPSNCGGSGSCGLCRILYEENIPEQTPIDREWIDADSIASGMRLACQHRPRAGDAILVPDVAFQQVTSTAKVVASRWLTPLLKEIRLSPDLPIDFVPGDYLEIQIPAFEVDQERMGILAAFEPFWRELQIPVRWSYNNKRPLSRTYSIATADSLRRPQELKFMVRFQPHPSKSRFLPGIGSSFMCGLQQGDAIEFRGPTGLFRLHDSSREKIFIGGGSGMAPLRSMIKHLLEVRSWKGSLRFWYGARCQAEIPYQDEFEALAVKFENFEWAVSLSDAKCDRNWHGFRGLIHETIFRNVLDTHRNLEDCEFYVCGPPKMLAATRQMLSRLGVADHLVRYDDFGI